MNITKTFYAKNRDQWRKWLEKNHDIEKDIWLVYYKKNSGKPRVPYGEAVEEALCYGWIDSTTKSIDEEKYVQRFSPRRSKSNWSEPNLERIRRLIKEGKMAPAGMVKIENIDIKSSKIEISSDILNALESNKETWKNFNNFPQNYKKIRIAFIEGARKRPEELKKRLNYFLKMTKQNKKFGMKI